MNKSRPTPVSGEKLVEVALLHSDPRDPRTLGTPADPEDLPLADEPTSVVIKNDLDAVAELALAHDEIMAEINKRIIGQRRVIEQLLVALFARGHTLFVGVPGLAKTLLISTLAETLNLSFQRIQFTPDLMPADITGTEVLEEDHTTGRRIFRFIKGPVFANLVLADEINRTPPKTQAALLQAMQEHQITAGATAITSSRSAIGRPSIAARAFAPNTRYCDARGPAPQSTYSLMNGGASPSGGRVIRASVTADRISPRDTGIRRTSACMASTEAASSTGSSETFRLPVVCSTIASSSARLG